MNLVLVKASFEYKNQIVEMLKEWTEYNNKIDDNKSPSAIFKNSYDNFDNYLYQINSNKIVEGLVPDTTYFAYDIDRNIMVGAVNIRHYLNEHLFNIGGHIGDGVRPSERRKGYATKIISLALDKCKDLGINKVLITCDSTNIGSVKSIINNGGILENEIIKDGKKVKRYWIEF